MSKLMHVDQGHPEDNFYALEDDQEALSCGDPSDLTVEEMGLETFIEQVEQFIEEVGPVLGSAVIDIMNMNEMCMKITEMKRRTRDGK